MPKNTKVIDKFHYHLEDLECVDCLHYKKKHGCGNDICLYDDIRTEAIANGRTTRRKGWNKYTV
jgi:hypothetical protein